MTKPYAVTIVGAGPAGLSAAAQAAACGMSHVLLERTSHLADTQVKYQKGKFVMATPDILPLRSTLSFEAGSREEGLAAWSRDAERLGINIRYNTEVKGVTGTAGDFVVQLADGNTVRTACIVLAIGLQGNLRQLTVPGADQWDNLQYQLDDPDEYADEVIVVIGAGDSAIENAVALTKQNEVYVVNRGDDFARAKDGNLALITKAIDKGDITCFYNAAPVQAAPGRLTLETPDGQVEVPCDRIVARLGAIPPRTFVESLGIVFPTDSPLALPEVSRTYESNVSGLYIIGALSGFPLIKQAMNQGYEVIEYLRGNTDLKPADEPLMAEKFKAIVGKTVDEMLDSIRRNVPLFAQLNPLMLRELILDSEVHCPRAGEVIFSRNDYTNSLYSIVEGAVDIQVDPADPHQVVTREQGAFFGEMGLLAGRRRSATVVAHAPSVLLETNRRAMIKLLNSVPEVKRVLDETAIVRHIQTYLAPSLTEEDLKDAVQTARLLTFKQNEALFHEGDRGDGLYLVRKGSVTVARRIKDREVVFAYRAAGNYVGEMALLSDAPRSATVRAATNGTETIKIEGTAFMELLARAPDVRAAVEAVYRERLTPTPQATYPSATGSVLEFLLQQGMGNATDMLLIDESLCVRCNNCETACAETHDGISRLDREAGPTFANIHVPTSCRHCEHPYCMTDCPPDAIRRSSNGEVFINDSCIGCGNCAHNCPYGVIQLAARPPRKPGLLGWLLFGRGPGPGQDRAVPTDGPKLAVKCDMCKDLTGGPACVRACPTGAAERVSPEEFFAMYKGHARR